MNKELLYYEIKKRKKTIEDVYRELGISKSAFYRKVSCKTQFTLEELKKIVVFLGLKSPDEIFFADVVS